MTRTLSQPPPPRKLSTGNRCGFILEVPRCFTDGAGFSAFPFLASLQNAIWHLSTGTDEYLYAGRCERGKLHDRPRPRAERREAIVCVLQYMASHLQVKNNLRILLFPTAKGIPFKQIAQAAGVSYDRVRRAVENLTSCGYIHSYQPREKTAAGWRGRPAVRRFTFKLLKVLPGIWRAYKRLRKSLNMKPPREDFSDQPIKGLIVRTARIKSAHHRLLI